MKSYILLFIILFFYTNVNAQWEPDRKLSTGTDPASLNENMGKCIAVYGNVIHVVWYQSTSGSGIYYKRSSDAGITWGSDIRLTAVPSSSDYPSIAVSGNMLHIAYRDSTTSDRTSNYIRSTNGGNTWESPVSLGNYLFGPSISVSGTIVYVALNSYSTGNSEIWFRRSTNNGTTWEPAFQISNASGRSEMPSIAAGGALVHIAWNDTRTDTMQTFYRRSTDEGVTWESEVQRTNSTVSAHSPSLSLTGSDVDLVWADLRNGNNEIYHLHSTDFGSSWGAEERLSNDLSTSLNPNIIRSGSNVHLIWAGLGLLFRFSGNSGVTWNNQVKLVNESSSPILPFVAVTGQVVHLIWTDHRDGYNAVYYKRNPTGNAGSQDNSITVISVPLQLCSGADFVIQYQTSGTFFGDNVFTAQISDGLGNFSNPIDIGTINATSSGTMTSTLPSYLIPAAGYRIRINSSSPTAIGTKNASDITINVLPSPVIHGTSEGCRNSSLIFTTDTITGHTYKWTATGGIIQGADNQQSVTVNWTSSNLTGTINLTETTITTGCSNVISKEITINSLPDVNIQGSQNGCRNQLQTFSATSSPVLSYKWSVTGGTIMGADNENNLTVDWNTPDSTGTVSLSVTNNVTGCINSGNKIIAINSLPLPSITGSSDVCYNSTNTYFAPPGFGNSYLWRIEGGSIDGADNLQDVRINWNSPDSIGTITLIQTIDSTGCSDSVSKNIVINPLPVPAISGPLTSLKNMNQHYSVVNNTGSSYKWYVEGGIFVADDDLSEVDIHWGDGSSGNLKIIETNSDGCTDSSEITVTLLISSVDDIEKNNYSIKVYPNPSSGIINLEVFNNEPENFEIEITNVYGMTVRKIYSGIIADGIFKTVWDGTDSNSNQVFSGIYFAKIKSNSINLTAKFVLIK